jgi:hypothetical protein
MTDAHRSIGRLIAAVMVMAMQPRVEPARWWHSGRIVAALKLRTEQSRAIERVYENAFPSGCRASLDVAELTNRISDALQAGSYDNDLLRLTERLFMARSAQAELRGRVMVTALDALEPPQRAQWSRLIADRHIVE